MVITYELVQSHVKWLLKLRSCFFHEFRKAIGAGGLQENFRMCFAVRHDNCNALSSKSTQDVLELNRHLEMGSFPDGDLSVLVRQGLVQARRNYSQ